MIGKARRRFADAVLVVLVLVLSACQVDAAVTPMASDPHLIVREPLGAADFVQALGGGDEVAAEEVASPLYRAEWERQGLSLAQRLDLHADLSAASERGEVPLGARFVGGIVDSAGFGHDLYLAGEGDVADGARSAIWRVDTAPDGRVIWAERVWLFGDDGAATTTVGSASTDGAVVPDELRPGARARGCASPSSPARRATTPSWSDRPTSRRTSPWVAPRHTSSGPMPKG